MKKFFYSFIAAVATMFSVTSCSQEEVVGNEASGNEVEVTFNATMEGQAISRNIGDGLTVDELYFAVYDEEGNEIGNLRQDGYHGNAVPVSGLGATVKVRLVKGQTYQFVFWAQKSGAAHYNTADMKAIKVNDYTTISNDETRDAFYAYVGATKVTGPFSQNVELKRPFAQLNLGTTAEDWGWATTAGVEITDTKVTVNKVYTTLNTFDGSVADEVTADFALNAIPSQGDLLKTDNKNYYYLSTNYLLAPAEKALAEEIVFTLEDDGKEINTLKVYNAPLQRNWRTNIVGEILTGEGTFNITIDPIFDGDRNYDMPGSELEISDFILKDGYAEVGSAEALLKWAYLANFTNNALGLQLTNDITLPAYTIEADAANETYVFTQTPITLDAEGIPSGSNWIPVRNNNDAGGQNFVGVIDGNNYSINGLTINYTKVTAGLVGYMEGGTIKNLTLNNANVYSTQAYTGAFVGYNEDNSWIENCHLVQSKVEGKLMVGGIVGSNWTKDNLKSSAVIKSCSTDQSSVIKGNGTTAGNGGSMRGVGGIAGQNWGGIILNCTNNATINGISYIGGIVGSTKPSDTQQGNSNGYVIGCVNNGNVAATSGNVGGIAGENMSAHSLKSYIVGCSSSASSISGSTKGLLVGYNTKCFVYASWAKAINTIPLIGTSAANLYAEVYAWESITDITNDAITAMNTQIGVYNTIGAIEQCPYSWSMTSGNWPKLK